MLAAAALVLLLAGRMVLRYLDYEASASQRDLPATIDETKLETLAAAACLCTRKAGKDQKKKCWQAYEDAAPKTRTSGYGTACAPVSTETDCFMTASGEKCVVTGYSVGSVELCTANEARAIEEAEKQGWLGPDGKAPDPDDEADWQASDRRAGAAVDRMLKRIMAGEAVSPVGPIAEGCTG